MKKWQWIGLWGSQSQIPNHVAILEWCSVPWWACLEKANWQYKHVFSDPKGRQQQFSVNPPTLACACDCTESSTPSGHLPHKTWTCLHWGATGLGTSTKLNTFTVEPFITSTWQPSKNYKKCEDIRKQLPISPIINKQYVSINAVIIKILIVQQI